MEDSSTRLKILWKKNSRQPHLNPSQCRTKPTRIEIVTHSFLTQKFSGSFHLKRCLKDTKKCRPRHFFFHAGAGNISWNIVRNFWRKCFFSEKGEKIALTDFLGSPSVNHESVRRDYYVRWGCHFAQKILKWGNFFARRAILTTGRAKTAINEKMKPVDFYLESIYRRI